MKLLAYSEDDIKVNYFGIPFSTPNFGYIAIDKDGSVYWYASKPAQSMGGKKWVSNSSSFISLGKVDLESLYWGDSCCPVVNLTQF